MFVDKIWDFKSLNMGRELEIAGEFIYDSAKKTMSISGLNNTYEINIILYTGAVGIHAVLQTRRVNLYGMAKYRC